MPEKSSHTTELRTYTLASADAVHQYTTSFWPRHIASLRKHGVTVHGVWAVIENPDHRVIALIGYPPGADPEQLAATYRASTDYLDDHAHFDMSQVSQPVTTVLEAIPGSSLE
jgi:NIPSNAP